jgi:hypothetical protein
VAGKVTLDGTPLTLGAVIFQNEEGKQVVTEDIGPNGDYEIRDVPVGAAKICLVFSGFAGEQEFVLSPKGTQAALLGKRLPRMPNADTAPILPEPMKSVPLAYKHLDASGLRFTVASGDNRFDLKLSRARR